MARTMYEDGLREGGAAVRRYSPFFFGNWSNRDGITIFMVEESLGIQSPARKVN